MVGEPDCPRLWLVCIREFPRDQPVVTPRRDSNGCDFYNEMAVQDDDKCSHRDCEAGGISNAVLDCISSG